MTKRFVKRAILMTILLISGCFLPFSASAQGDASGAISSAKQQIVTCYDSAKQAETAGANISALTSILNDAGDLLSRAELAYSQGDLESAQSFASQCSQTLNGFAVEAGRLREASLQRNMDDFWVYVVGSLVGTLIAIIAGLAVWWSLKRRDSAREVQDYEP